MTSGHDEDFKFENSSPIDMFYILLGRIDTGYLCYSKLVAGEIRQGAWKPSYLFLTKRKRFLQGPIAGFSAQASITVEPRVVSTLESSSRFPWTE